MPSRTKGITIEINGDATKLDDSLKAVNKSLSDAGKGLRDVNRLLKLDPSNVELLRQKQDYLAQAVEGTKEKLGREKEALEQLKKSDGFDASSESARALERQIAADEQALKRLTDEVKSLPTPFQASMQEAGKKVEEIGSKIEAVGDKVTKAGEFMTTHVTAPIVAAGGASVAAWKEVDEALDTVTTKTGASGEALEDMQQRVKNLAETIPTDFQTAADAVGEVNTRFGLTGDSLEDLSGKFVKFAELNETDVSSSVDSVQSAMAAWGISAKDAGLVLDTFNKAGQDTGINVDRLSEMLKVNKTALDEAGLSFSDSAMFLANLDKNGVDAGAAITGLKKALQNATKDGKTSAQALSELQAAMGDGSNKAEAYAAATELFGAKAGPAIADACAEGRLSFEALGTSMSDFAGSVETTFGETLDPLDEMQMSMNTMKDLGADIVETAAPMITEAMTAIRDAITSLKEKWDGLDEGQQQTIIKILGIIAVIGPMLVILGTVISTVGSIIATIGGLIPMLGAPLLGPIALVVAAVAAAIAIGVALYKNWDTIKEKATEFVENIKQKWEDFKTDTLQKFTDIKDGAKEKVEEMKASIDEKFGWIADKAEDIFEKVRGFIEDPIGSAKEFVRNAIEDIKGFFDFEWHLPDLKLPHIHVGSYIDVPVLGTIPDPRTLRVDWYDKAMDTPRILKDATIFGMAGGRLLGGGESGEEVVSGKNTLIALIKDAVAGVMQSMQTAAQLPAGTAVQSALLAMAQAARAAGDTIRNYNHGDVNITVYGAEGQDVSELARIVKDDIKNEWEREEAVFA